MRDGTKGERKRKGARLEEGGGGVKERGRERKREGGRERGREGVKERGKTRKDRAPRNYNETKLSPLVSKATFILPILTSIRSYCCGGFRQTRSLTTCIETDGRKQNFNLWARSVFNLKSTNF